MKRMPVDPKIETIKVWIHAFIPRDIPGLTDVVPDNPLAARVISPPRPLMVPPLLRYVDLRGLTMFRTVLGCGLTDQRSFSNDIRPMYRFGSELRRAYRLRSEAQIDVLSDKFTPSHDAGKSV